jgi:hypothetical protein
MEIMLDYYREQGIRVWASFQVKKWGSGQGLGFPSSYLGTFGGDSA